MEFAIRYWRILLVSIVLSNFSFYGCGEPNSLNWTEVLDFIHKEFPDVRQLSTEELADWLKDHNRKPPTIFDTREQQEYGVSHIQNARYLDPKSNLEVTVKQLDKKSPIVVYCSVGYRSSIVAQKLQDLGYTNVYNLDGSIFKWANEGRTVVRNEVPTSEVHPYDSNWGRLLDKQYHPTPY